MLGCDIVISSLQILWPVSDWFRGIRMSRHQLPRVYLGGLSYRAGDRDVEHFFRRYIYIELFVYFKCIVVNLNLNYRYGRLKEISLKNGYAFVEFEDIRDAEDAVYDLHGVSYSANGWPPSSGQT